MWPTSIHCCTRLPQRWVFAAMGFLAILNMYIMRNCLSLAIVEMVVSTESSSNVTSDAMCSHFEDLTSTVSNAGNYQWSQKTQGLILSSFYWGYVITHLPGGRLAEIFGGKYTLGLAILVSSILTLFTPIVVNLFDSTGLIALRVVLGLAEGMVFPAMTVLIAKWAPPQERSMIGTMVIAGTELGTVIGASLSGVLMHNFTIGWPLVFYSFGTCGVLWFIGWVVLGANTPEQHPFISEKEKIFLREAMRDINHEQAMPIPWSHLLRSAPLWALIIGAFGFDWGFYTFATDLPKYMKSTLRFSIQTNGFFTALPYFFMWVCSIASSFLVDWMITTNRLSRTNARKILGGIASIGPAIFVVAASYAGCDRVGVVVLFTVGLMMMGLTVPSMKLNPVDLSPNFSGTLMAIVNGIGCISGMVAPYAVGVLTPNETITEWRVVFWMTFVILVASSLVFVIWGSGDIQYWNDPQFRGRLEMNDVYKSNPERITRNDEVPMSPKPFSE